MKYKYIQMILSLLAAMSCVSCSSLAKLGAGPDEKAILARPDMQIDAQPLTSALDDHIYFSKEASSGGRGFGGGGCGCN